MIIEFNGLSGTGKTTIAHLLGDKLETMGYSVEYTYVLKESWLKRYCMYMFDGSIMLWLLGRRFAEKSVYPRRADRRRYVSNLVAYYRMYRAFIKEKPDSVLVIDQGFMQALASIVHMDQITETSVLRHLFGFLRKQGISFYSVESENDPLLSLARIRQRNNPSGRWEQCSDEEMKSGLFQQAETFAVIRECVHMELQQKYISINTKLSPDRNAQKILAFITER